MYLASLCNEFSKLCLLLADLPTFIRGGQYWYGANPGQMRHIFEKVADIFVEDLQCQCR